MCSERAIISTPNPRAVPADVDVEDMLEVLDEVVAALSSLPGFEDSLGDDGIFSSQKAQTLDAMPT